MIERSLTYAQLKKAIESELIRGAERVKQSYREEVIKTAWNVGKLLRRSLGFRDQPSQENAALIVKLSGDLGRPDAFFYDAAKFHRLYPGRPPLALSWSHYSLLIRIEDQKKRAELEAKALKEVMSAKDLRIYTRLDRDSVSGGSAKGELFSDRGCLYHYRAANAPSDGRVLIDIGFGIERDVRSSDKGSFHSGLIVRTVKAKEIYTVKIAAFDKNRLYSYAAALERVIDGDTLVVRVDLGFRTWITQTLRLRGIDAPEVTSALGRKAKQEVSVRLEACPWLAVKTYKQEKYGRFLADIFYLKGCEDKEKILKEGVFLNQELLDLGLAEIYNAI